MDSASRRPQASPSLEFLLGFLRRPKTVGSVVPSSRFLIRRVVEVAGLADARRVVELGPGPGVTTAAFLRAMPADSRLLAIEIDPGFVRHLETLRDPRLIVHGGSAETLAQTAAHHGMRAVDVVVSGIPFSTMPPAVGSAILEEIRDALAPDGSFVAYQLRDQVAKLARPVFGEPEVALELLNLPPMRIYRWRKAASPTPSARGGPAPGPSADR